MNDERTISERLEDDRTVGVGIGVIRIGLGLDGGIWYRIEWGWDLWCMYLLDVPNICSITVLNNEK